MLCIFKEVIRKHTLRHSGKVFGAITTAATSVASTAAAITKSTGEQLLNAISTTTGTAAPITTPSTSKYQIKFKKS